ncbi:SAM-dependent methyltransferase [Neisseriaceae bacterium CLB008]|nr:SAM-dependent methyltransferase [Neisseriaceae bacterium]
MSLGTLYLIPTPLGDEQQAWLLPHEQSQVTHITHFVVEAEKTARKHLKAMGVTTPIRELSMNTLNEHSDEKALPELIKPLLAGHDVGLVSEAGCPAIADPGANLVALAHKKGIPVRPLMGASSIFLALMASGANGQSFTFKGYLPSDKAERLKALKQLEQTSQKNNETQIFIETPYRNQAVLEDALAQLAPSTRLCIACDLTLPSQTIISQTVANWPKDLPNLHKRPCIFIIHHQ